jgi:hypothetical protein
MFFKLTNFFKRQKLQDSQGIHSAWAHPCTKVESAPLQVQTDERNAVA